jgi:hypothetical protein
VIGRCWPVCTPAIIHSRSWDLSRRPYWQYVRTLPRLGASRINAGGRAHMSATWRAPTLRGGGGVSVLAARASRISKRHPNDAAANPQARHGTCAREPPLPRPCAPPLFIYARHEPSVPRSPHRRRRRHADVQRMGCDYARRPTRALARPATADRLLLHG